MQKMGMIFVSQEGYLLQLVLKEKNPTPQHSLSQTQVQHKTTGRRAILKEVSKRLQDTEEILHCSKE